VQQHSPKNIYLHYRSNFVYAIIRAAGSTRVFENRLLAVAACRKI